MSNLYRTLVTTALVAASTAPLTAQSPGNVSLKNEVRLAIERGLDFLGHNQFPEGYWSTGDYPGLSALVVQAYLTAPLAPESAREHPACRKGLAFLVSRVQDDGGIYTPAKGLANYNTAISLVALHEAGDPAYDEIIRRARAFTVGQQQLQYEEGTEAYAYHGGIGYGNSYAHSDMSNTSLAIQALHETRDLLEQSAEYADEPRLDWDAAIGYLTRSQNLPETNPMDWASGHPAHRGGFVYFPGNSKAGETELPGPDGKPHTVVRSYGSMSYAGLMSLVYARLEPDDPRVTAALDWLQRHWTVEENPNMGDQGLYYYYMTIPKALNAAGVEQLQTPDGPVDWREELARELLERQRDGGLWRNDTGRWMEADANLATAYALLALNRIYDQL
jgi:squalene-hopene/tetraprenyl-beta-curcumene cyclase